MKENFNSYLSRKRYQLPNFSDESLSKQFIPYFESGERIEVETCGMILRGTIGVTTGWKPCFLLMRTKRSISSPWTLSDKDKILSVIR
jgi:hypothetical protein